MLSAIRFAWCGALLAVTACAACAPKPASSPPPLLDELSSLGCSARPRGPEPTTRAPEPTPRAPEPTPRAPETTTPAPEPVRVERSLYWPERGQTRVDQTFDHGQLEGPAAWFDAAGRKIAEGAYHDGQPTGTWTAYHGTGAKIAEVILDPKSPRYKTWDPDGTPAMSAEMDADFHVVKVDGRDARSACLILYFQVQTDKPSEVPFWVSSSRFAPCSVPAPAPETAAAGVPKASPPNKGAR